MNILIKVSVSTQKVSCEREKKSKLILTTYMCS